MPLLNLLARVLFLRRLLGGGRHAGRRRRGGLGMFGPVPTYSRRTRRGTQVSVGGCCLPIPLALVLGAATGARALHRR